MLLVSTRTKRIRITICSDGSLKVTVPKYVPHTIVEDFLLNKSRWILEKIEECKNNQQSSLLTTSNRTYTTHKEKARAFVSKKVEYFNRVYNFKWNKISIRNQKTRWGSCSKKGNLNFNYKIVLLPEYLSDYIVVHELCHLKEFNHGKKFWSLVAETLPNHMELRKELQKNSLRF